MARQVIPWRRKPKIKNLCGGLTTAHRFAVVGSPEKFIKKLHAYKVLNLLTDLGAEVFPVSPELDKLGKFKVYPSLQQLPKSVDVVIPCLAEEYSLSIVEEANAAGIPNIWFQQKTLSEEAAQFCTDNNLQIIEGCVLMYRDFGKILKLVNPCFWHGKTFARKEK